jgi:DNA gyrase subunit A
MKVCRTIGAPTRFPNLLVNGFFGLRWDANEHSAPQSREVIDATVALIDDDTLSSKDLTKYIKVRFSDGGTIIGKSGLISALSTGRGRVKLRAKTRSNSAKAENRRSSLLRFRTWFNKAKLVEKIAELVKEKRVVGITDIHEYSDRKGIKIEIDLKRDANAQIILNQLFKFTHFMDTFGVIMLALVNNQAESADAERNF